jgi:CRP-like cAMP-binding protein
MAGPEDTAFRVRSTYERTLAPGEAVFDEGDAGENLYVIQSGEIEITRDGVAGHRTVARLGAGDFFGELAMVAGQPRNARAVAVKATRVLEFDRLTLESMCVGQPEIALRLIRILVARLVEAERRLAALGVDDLLRPVVRTLVRGAEPAAQGQGFRVSTTLRRLAEHAGLSMLEAHRALDQLFDRKVCCLVDDVLMIPDLEALSACLDPPD